MDGNKMEHSLLILGGTFSFLFALMHLVIIYIGAPAYQFFGAGDSMVSLAERGSWVPAVVTLGVTAVLFGFTGYAWAAADLVSGLPFVFAGTLTVGLIYTLRGAGVVVMFFMPQDVSGFDLWSSALAFFVGVVHLVGLYGSGLEPALNL